MCSIGLKSGLTTGLFLGLNTAVRSKSIFKFLYHREFGSIQVEILSIIFKNFISLGSTF